jgi:hypothetical protein
MKIRLPNANRHYQQMMLKNNQRRINRDTQNLTHLGENTCIRGGKKAPSGALATQNNGFQRCNAGCAARKTIESHN